MIDKIGYFFKYQPLFFYMLLSINNRWVKSQYLDYSLLFCSFIIIGCMHVLSYLGRFNLKENRMAFSLNWGYIIIIYFFHI